MQYITAAVGEGMNSAGYVMRDKRRRDHFGSLPKPFEPVKRQRNNNDNNPRTFPAFHSSSIRSEAADNVIAIEPSKPEIKEVFTRPEVVNRNKRLLGSLMGHLGQARQRLEKDVDLIKKRKELEEAASERSAKEVDRAEEQRHKAIQLQILNKKIDDITKAAELYTAYLESIAHFIVTDVEPKICWLPANSNKVSKDLLHKRNEDILRLIAERETEDAHKIQKAKDDYNIAVGLKDEYSEIVVQEPVEESYEVHNEDDVGLDVEDIEVTQTIQEDNETIGLDI